MPLTSYNLREFYRTLGGRIVRRLIVERLAKMWPDMNGYRLLGAGYATPFLRDCRENSERTVCVMYAGQGVHHWPADEKNSVCLAHETELPFETNSIDRILVVHSLEYTGFMESAFEELWRVLKSNGRVIVIVPNRIGLWARADWTPFGHGTPYTSGQVENFLKENRFIPERTERAVFVPPFRSQTLLRSALLWEKIGHKLCAAMGGLVLVEASKQIYAGTGRTARVRETLPAPKPVTAPEPILRRK